MVIVRLRVGSDSSSGAPGGTILYIKQVITRNVGFSAMPRSILRVLVQKSNLMFEPHVQTNGEHAFFVFVFSRQVMAVFVFFRIVFSRQVMGVFVFFRIVVSVISLEQI